jgi:magnesium transporter
MSVNQVQMELLRKLLRHGARERVVRILDKFRPAELADLFAHLSPAEQKQFVDVLYSQKQAAETLSELPEGILEDILELLGDERIVSLLERLAPDDAAHFVSLLDDDRVDRVLDGLGDHTRERIEHIRLYPPESAGSLMTSEMLTMSEALTAQEAIDLLRDRAADSEFIFYVYVVNENDTFLGVVPIRRLITAPAQRPLRDVMVTNPIAVQATDDQEKVADVTARYNLLAVPVVDDNFRLLGVITVDDVIDVLQEEATEDMYLMQGLSDEDRVYSPISTSIRKRFPWMVLNLASAFMAASVVGLFEESISQLVILATFMPIVAGMGGNGGTQTLTVITRGIALGELEYADGYRAIVKQLSIGVIVGGGIGIITGSIAWLWKGNPVLGMVLFVAMLLNMAIAGLAGAAVPILLKALKQDPAMGGGVVVTTFTDTCGFFAFLGLATLFMPYIT